MTTTQSPRFYTTDQIFNLCAEFMNDQAADGIYLTADEALASFEDAHDYAIIDTNADRLWFRLDNVARAIRIHGAAL